MHPIKQASILEQVDVWVWNMLQPPHCMKLPLASRAPPTSSCAKIARQHPALLALPPAGLLLAREPRIWRDIAACLLWGRGGCRAAAWASSPWAYVMTPAPTGCAGLARKLQAGATAVGRAQLGEVGRLEQCLPTGAGLPQLCQHLLNGWWEQHMPCCTSTGSRRLFDSRKGRLQL